MVFLYLLIHLVGNRVIWCCYRPSDRVKNAQRQVAQRYLLDVAICRSCCHCSSPNTRDTQIPCAEGKPREGKEDYEANIQHRAKLRFGTRILDYNKRD